MLSEGENVVAAAYLSWVSKSKVVRIDNETGNLSKEVVITW